MVVIGLNGSKMTDYKNQGSACSEKIREKLKRLSVN